MRCKLAEYDNKIGYSSDLFQAICGFHLGYMKDQKELIRYNLHAVLDLYKQGKVKPTIDSSWAAEDVRETLFFTWVTGPVFSAGRMLAACSVAFIVF